MRDKIAFGTDGFRGIIADNFTFSAVERIAVAYADYLHEHRQGTVPEIVVGYDHRFLSPQFARHVAEVLAGCGIKTLLSREAVPTPAISSYIRRYGLTGGVIITASHNPAKFNGFKIKDGFGASAPRALTEDLERRLSYPRLKNSKMEPATLKSVAVLDPYVARLQQYVDVKRIGRQGYRVVVDAMYGVGAGVVEKVLQSGKCSIETIRAEVDPLFGGINPEPIESNLEFLKKTLKRHPCDLALAFDGDADRIGAMTPSGRFINSHYAICLILLHLIEHRKWNGRVIKSLNTTSMVDRIADRYQLPLQEVPVGFKYIAEEMLKGDVLLGGEESGGIGFKDYMPERDGILSGLLLLELMAVVGKPITSIIQDMDRRFGKRIYRRRDVHLPPGSRRKSPPAAPAAILGKTVSGVKDYDGIKYILEDGSWLIIRASGTEPVLRIYAESGTKSFTEALIHFGFDLWTKH